MWFAAKQLENVSRCDFIRDVEAYSDHSHCDMVNFGVVAGMRVAQHGDVALSHVCTKIGQGLLRPLAFLALYGCHDLATDGKYYR